jgi:hypothetical protein
MSNGILILESVWDNDIHSTLSVRPMIEGMAGVLNVKFGYRTFHDNKDITKWLELFIRSPEYLICYVAGHGAGARLSGTDKLINLGTVAKELKRVRRTRADDDGDKASSQLIDKGIIFGACDVGCNVEKFCDSAPKGINWVAGYTTSVPWVESTLCDMLLIKYIISEVVNYTIGDLGSHLTPTGRIRSVKGALTIDNIVDYVVEDFPMAASLGLRVAHR